MVGSCVLQSLLANPEVGQIVSISRRPTGVDDPKLTELIHGNFLDFSSLLEELRDIDACFYCLGVYLKTVSKDQYFEITCDYQTALMKTLAQASPKATFVLFGAMGADPSERSRMTFAKAKGRAESLLLKTDFPLKYIFRPAYINPKAKAKYSANGQLATRQKGLIAPILERLMISKYELGQAMVNVAINASKPSQTFENRAIHQCLV